MRCHQQPALIAAQKILKPDQALKIEMVAWLIEQHRIGPHEQNAGERHAHFPAARQRPDVALHHLLAETQARQHFARAPVERIAIQLLKARLHFAIALDDVLHLVRALRVRHGGLKRLQLGCDLAHRPCPVHNLGNAAATRHLANVLAEIADGDSAIDANQPLIWRLLACHHAEKRCLAGPVRPDKPHLLAPLQRGGRLDEKDLVAVLFADVLKTNHGARTCKKLRRSYATSKP